MVLQVKEANRGQQVILAQMAQLANKVKLVFKV
jgi:hypothetical protein